MKSSNPKIVAENVEQAVQLMRDQDIDTWLILTREGTDPALPLLVGVRSVHQAAILLRSDHQHIALSSMSDKGVYKDTNLFAESLTYEADMGEDFLKVFEKLSCKKLALNISETDHMCDGLTGGLYRWLSDLLGEKRLSEIEVSSEQILKEIRNVKNGN